MTQRRLTTALGLFLVCLATLVLEVGLTRLLSVTVWYHFSFAAVSFALLGMSAGAGFVYLRRERLLPAGRPPAVPLAWAALALAVTLPATVALYLQIDLSGAWAEDLPWLRLLPTLLFVAPFFASGVVVSLVLTAYAADVGRLYAWDLLGAGLGGPLLVVLIDVLTGPTVLLAMGVVAAAAALLFALGAPTRRERIVALAVLVATAGLFGGNVAFDWIGVRYTKAYDEATLPRVYEEWGPIARLTVFDRNWARDGGPYGWGLSHTYTGPTPDELWVEQDAAAGTPITRYDGDPKALPHLGYDVTALPYHVLDAPDVAVIGIGGGRDALTALHFGATHVTGIEVNPDMVALVANRFADFAGHLYDDPRVEVVAADGRSWLAHTDRRFDLVQISLIDSWAASAAGAFVLAENSLYTREAFATYWEHLTERGLLSVSRWCMSDRPGELLRLTGLALTTLRDAGVRAPERHVAVVTYRNRVGTLLLKKTPFVAHERMRITDTARRLGFDIAFLPGRADGWPAFTELFAAYDRLPDYWAEQPMDLSPPTDDRPFFFLILRLRDALDTELSYELGLPYNATAVRTLLGLLVAVLALVLLLVLLPLRTLARRDPAAISSRLRSLGYFGALGLGYILVEVPLIQKLILFLGHPTYALTTVLSTLLVASGLGSRLTDPVLPANATRRARWVLPAVVAAGLAMTLGLDPLLALLMPQALSVRVVAAVVALAPLGLLMGMPFPLGVKMVEARGETASVPWIWGVNGATSVLATVLAFVLALGAGYRWALAAGLAAYSLAGVLVWIRPKRLPSFFGQSERSEATPGGRGGAMEAEPD